MRVNWGIPLGKWAKKGVKWAENGKKSGKILGISKGIKRRKEGKRGR